jgi:hypothetical protein
MKLKIGPLEDCSFYRIPQESKEVRLLQICRLCGCDLNCDCFSLHVFCKIEAGYGSQSSSVLYKCTSTPNIGIGRGAREILLLSIHWSLLADWLGGVNVCSDFILIGWLLFGKRKKTCMIKTNSAFLFYFKYRNICRVLFYLKSLHACAAGIPASLK